MIKLVINPKMESWKELLVRPQIVREDLRYIVEDILFSIKNKGDEALLEYTQRFDGVNLKGIKVSEEEMSKGVIGGDLKKAIDLARRNIETFHKNQDITEPSVETSKGVTCWRRSVPIENVGLYIPGGSAPLLSTVLMLGIPAQLAGCNNIILCSPPNPDGQMDSTIICTAKLLGIDNLYKVGGAQAIAAMAYGTRSIPKVDKIFGPGNQFVTEAKSQVQQSGVAIDMPAGPSEVLIIADHTSNIDFVAADLLSQAEHGPDSHVVLLSDNKKVIDGVMAALKNQLEELPRRKIAEQALKNSLAVVLTSLQDCMAMSNAYAPEHLILQTAIDDVLARDIVNAGSVFIGKYSCESAGDYASGTNHTLPTNGHARNYSGLSLDSFMKKISFQKITSEGIKNIGPAIETMAAAEQLMAHKNAVTLRLKEIKNV